MSHQQTTHIEKESVDINELISMLSGKSSTPGLPKTEAAAPTVEVYEFANKKFTGEFTLKFKTVEKAVNITDCDFEGTVDLRECQFLETANFSGCHFFKDVICGDKEKYPATFKKDFICKGAHFDGKASFYGIVCEGNAVFNGAVFENEKEEVHFDAASFEKDLVLDGAIFKGGADFTSITCGHGGFLNDARFLNRESTIDFAQAAWGKTLECKKAEFEGGANFNSISCDYVVDFEGTTFKNIEKKIEFDYSTFGNALNCKSVTFRGPASFNSIKCGVLGNFTDAKFENGEEKTEIDFSYSFYGTALQCVRTRFHGNVIFDTVKCEGVANFDGVQFDNPARSVNFKFSRVGGNLNMRGVVLKSAVSLDHSQLAGSLNLRRSFIHGRFSLFHTSIKRLAVGDQCPFIFSNLDLRECAIESFDGEKPLWRQFVQSQEAEHFSRDPYLQLEKYYQRIGDEVEARNIYYSGRSALRKQAVSSNNESIKWPLGRNIGDFLLKLLSGYGVQPWRLYIIIALFLVTGAVTFWADDALKPKAQLSKQSQGGNQERSQADRPSTAGQRPPEGPTLFKDLPSKERHFNSIIYSLDLFVPVIKFGLADNWQPATFGREVYATIHKAAGWFLIPLLVASWSGLIRKQ